MRLFYLEMEMRKGAVKKEKNATSKFAEPWYFAHV
jgi:hypothetical protein